MPNETEKELLKDQKQWPIWLLFFSILFIWGFSSFLMYKLLPTPEDRGLFGDMFGSVNALFSGWAFAGVVYAIFLQKKELALQRYELAATRGEFKTQNETLARQRFENTFFNLLKTHSDLLSQVNVPDYRGGGNRSTGRDAFTSLWSFLKQANTRLSSHPNPQGIGTLLEQAFSSFYQQFKPGIGHYYTSLYVLLRFVDSAPINNKKEYFDLVVATLSMQELAMIFYYIACNSDGRNLRLIIEKWALLQSIDKTVFLDAQNDPLLIEATAFG